MTLLAGIALFAALAPGEALLTDKARTLQDEIDAVAAKGGGRVTVPAGEHLSDGPLRLRSNVELHLEEGARIVFPDDPAKYLPAVPTSWEGVECLNYSPLVYAYGCTNVAITGKGTLAPKMDFWRTWFGRGKGHRDATRKLYDWCSFNAPLADRDLTKIPDSNVRPHLIQFNRCKNVQLEGFRIRESPFWTIHLYLCDGVVARGLDVYAHGHNNDGIDIEMTRNVLVENCRFDQGDDAIVVKSGRNQDAWRLATPSENIEVRNCTVVNGHVLLGVGSEMSGGVRNVYMHDCTLESEALRLFYVKTNERRGGFVENIRMENVKAKMVRHGAMSVATDVLYQWKDFPTHEVRVTTIKNLVMKNVEVEEAERLVDVVGDARRPVDGVVLENVRIGKARKADRVQNAVNVSVNKCADVAPNRYADIFLVGDSTMCNYQDRQYPQQGWGQALYKFMKDPGRLHNKAIGGRSARSFKAEGRWQGVVDALKPGDFVVVAFGHNDANKAKKERYSSKEDYKALMKGFSDDVKAKGATILFATSIPHSGGVTKDSEGKTHVRGSAAGIGPYVEATRELGRENGIEVLDLNAYACEKFPELGQDEVFRLYMRIKPGEYKRFPDGNGDGCHTRDTGADFFARAVVAMCRERKLPVANLFKDPAEVPLKPIGFDGKPTDSIVRADDFSKEEIAYANADKSDWRSMPLVEPRDVGNYDVTMRLGDAHEATESFVKFQGRRLASDRIVTKPGEFVDFSFTARVPGPYTTRRGDERSNRDLGILVMTKGGSSAAALPKVVPAPDSRTIYLCGDSTVTDQQKEPWGSWGQVLPAFVRRGWAVSNFARSGLALKTFEGEGRLKRIFEHLRKDDWVVIQFGHNDQKIAGEEPEKGYTRRLNEWIDRIRERGAHPVLVTPVERRRFDEKTGEHLGKTLAAYADAMKAVAAAKGVPLVDLNDASYRMHAKMGPAGSKAIQCNNRGKIDNTHHNVYGAYEMARVVAAGLARIPVVGEAVRERYRDFDPEKPDADPQIPPSGGTDWTKPEGS